MASIGGFCAGEREVVDHQRLSGLGYCFSASLPPYLATAAIDALDRLDQSPELAQKVTHNAAHMRQLLQRIPGLKVPHSFNLLVGLCPEIWTFRTHSVFCSTQPPCCRLLARLKLCYQTEFGSLHIAFKSEASQDV